MGTRGNWECVHDNSCVHYMCAWCECDMTQHALRLLRISAEKKTCVCVNTKRKKLIRMTCLLERTALLLFPLLFLLVVTVRCLCVIVVFVWVISHSDLRSGQRALMHMGKKIIPLRTNGSSPSYSSASSPLLLSCPFVSQWRNETSATSTSLLLVSVQALFPLVIFWAPCAFPWNLCIHFLCCCAGWTSSVWEQLKSSRFFMFKSPSNKGLGFLRAAGQTFPFTPLGSLS